MAILAADYYIAGFSFPVNNFVLLVEAALVLTALNVILKPILKLFLGPFIILTFGLLIIVINAILLYIADWLIPEMHIATLWALFIATLLFSAVNFVFGFFLGKKK